IDECSEGTSGCTQICNNELGSYNCSCNTTEGYVLYTTNGTEMYYIPDIETGLRKGDSYHINHTCVLRMCPSPANAIINGKFLSGAYIFRVGERASYQCDLGYVMDGSTSMTCGADGQWIGEPPKCSVATCPPLNLTGLSAPPVVSPSSAVPYMSVVNMTCTVDGYNDPVVRTRQCLYDRTTNMYRLMGDRLECPVIDCGDPGVISGSNYTVGGTNFGDSFTFVCSRLNTLQGQSTMGDHVVRCRNNSRWDFGDLACKGDTCLDPGRPADGYQNATRYEQGSLVTYTCLRAGYEPRPEFPLMCIVVGDKLQWNASVPTCEDVESPQLMNCPQEVMYVKKYYAAGIIPPSATDNSGMATVTVSPATFLPNLTLTEPVNVTYTATDPSGNAVSCMVQIRIRSEMPPSLTCPDPVIVYIENNTLPKTVQFTGAVASAGAMVTYEPSEMTYNASDIDNLLSPVVVTARDMMNNTAQCRFHVAVKAANCTPWALPAPVNGMKSCMMSPGGGYTCTMTCDAGYAFEQAAGDLSYTCDGSQDWVPGNYVPDCVATSKALFTFSLRQTYDAAGGDLNDTCIQEYTALFNREIMAVTDAFEVNLGRFYVAGTNMTAIISDTTMGILSATQRGLDRQ
ncbi:sushi, von Willebrand factor type A, EGF and pentraxin domain-containing protein 1-like, partial [Lingula anatina]|uniref:Sushi, von Willebrand factor type A, EGF and pentraxin domain-containing protein 1-like n=1 Tax=Lingula anatina TaxID=7574 RepID=A0A1S3IVX0_LINAN